MGNLLGHVLKSLEVSVSSSRKCAFKSSNDRVDENKCSLGGSDNGLEVTEIAFGIVMAELEPELLFGFGGGLEGAG